MRRRTSKTASTGRAGRHSTSPQHGGTVLKKLFADYASKLGDHAWPWETARWYELVFCLLTAIGEPRVLSTTARHVTNRMAELGLLEVKALARLHDTGNAASGEPHFVTLVTTLERAGYSGPDARLAVSAICEAAHGLESHYGGKIQNYYRRYGEHMLARASEDFGLTGLEDGQRAIATWLQNTLGMPLPVSAPLTDQACRDLGVTYEALTDEANAQDVYVGLVDDALRAHWESRAASEGAGTASGGA